MKGFLKKHWRKVVLVVVCAPFVGYLALCLIIGLGVRNAVSDAQSSFPRDPVTALISVATNEEAKLSERNRAIWALGQLGSPEALPTLHVLVTGEKCDHDELICQREVETAIEACSGSTNIGAMIWRHGELAEASKGRRNSP